MALRAFTTLRPGPKQKRSSFAARKLLKSNPSAKFGTNPNLQAQFRSSSSQTTFLDRNIVQNLAVTASAPLTASSSKISSVGRSSTTTTACGTAMQGVSGSNHPRDQQQNVGTRMGGVSGPRRRRRPRTCPASYGSTSGGSGKRASFSGTLPEGKFIQSFFVKEILG